MNLKFIPALMLLVSSCSMFDDRSDCPSWLTLDVSTYGDSTKTLDISVNDYEKSIAFETVDITQTKSFSYRVQRVRHFCSVCYGYDSTTTAEGVYMIPLGKDMAHMYGSVKKELVPYDGMPDVVMPVDKQFARLYVDIEDDVTERFSQMTAMFSSSTGGVDLRSLEGVRGTFLYTSKVASDGTFNVCLPRQEFNDLTLAVLESGAVVQSYNIYSILNTVGYDWTAVSLEDIRLTLSLKTPEAAVDVKFGYWDEGGEYDYDL